MSEWTLSDIGVGGVVWSVLSLLCLIMAMYSTAAFRRQWQHGPPLTGRDVLGTFGAYFFVALFAWYAYSGIWGRHLLRIGSRYTVATITRVRRVKFEWKSHYVYAVGGVRYTTYVSHGSGPALPVGSRWWVRYAAADAAVHEWRKEAVPPFLDSVPARGWPRPPGEPPGFVPPVVDDPAAPRTATILDEEE